MSVHVKFNKFAQYGTALHLAVVSTVELTAATIQKDAFDLAPVDTGFLRNSIYVSLVSGSDYGSGGFLGKGTSTLLPEIAAPTKDTTAYIAVGADYGEYLEYGTRFMAAQPYFFQAVEWGRVSFLADLARIEPKLKGYVG